MKTNRNQFAIVRLESDGIVTEGSITRFATPAGRFTCHHTYRRLTKSSLSRLDRLVSKYLRHLTIEFYPIVFIHLDMCRV